MVHRFVLAVSLLFWFSLLSACTRQVERPADAPSPRTNSSHFDIENTRAPRTLNPRILESRTFSESPMWDRQVASGALPSISDRLPDNPRVIVPFKETGSYGGEIRRALTGDIVQIWGVMKAQNEGLFTFSHPYADTVEPNLAERWEYNDGGKQQIGIKVNVFAALRDIITPRRNSGEFEVHTFGFDVPGDPLFHRFAWAIDGPNQPYWHRNAASEGPEWLHEATQQFERAATTTDPVVIRESMAIAKDLHTDNVPNIAIGASYHTWEPTIGWATSQRM